MPLLFRCGVFILLVFLLTGHGAQAQVNVTAGADSSQVAPKRVPTAADSARRTERLFGLRMTRPAKATLLAAILPGAGQIYNKRYWKIPLAYGAVGGTLVAELFMQKRYTQYRTQRDYLAGKSLIDSTVLANSPYPNLLSGRTLAGSERGVVVFRNWRDQFIAYTLLAYGVTIIDALVDAHLRDFDISDDLSLHWEPTLLRVPTAALTPGLTFTFSLTSTRSPTSPK